MKSKKAEGKKLPKEDDTGPDSRPRKGGEEERLKRGRKRASRGGIKKLPKKDDLGPDPGKRPES